MRIRVLLLTLLLLAGCQRLELDYEVKNGTRLPSFSVITDAGETLTSEYFCKGYGLIVFFHTECPDCQQELPIIQNLYRQYGHKTRFIAISRNQSLSEIEKYWSENELTIPFSAQEDAAVFSLFASHTVPRTYFIKDGVIVAQWDDNPTMTENDFIKITTISN